MPSDDVILNLKQIAGYTATVPIPNDQLVIQRGGLGGPYLSMAIQNAVATALAYDEGPPMGVGVAPPADSANSTLFTGGIVTPFDGLWTWNSYINDATPNELVYLAGGPWGVFRMDPVAGWQFYGGTAGGAGQPVQNEVIQLQISPTGYLQVGEQVKLARDPAAPMEAATAQYVTSTVAGYTALLQSLYSTATVWSVNSRTGNVILNLNDVMGAGGAPIWSPNFQGEPTAPTPLPADSSNQIATTQWVWQALTNVSVSSFNGRTGAIVLTEGDVTGVGGIVNPSPALTGVPTAPTPAANDSSTQIATTAFVSNALVNIDLSNYAPLNSPNFSGVPTAPTPPVGANDGRIATTAFVHAAVVAATTGVSSFNTRTGAVTLTGADITSAGGALLAGPVFTGVPAAPTAAVNTNTTQIATTAFVMAQLAGGGVVTSFNTRTGAISLTTADITGAGGAPTLSPTLTGVPLAPTATAGTNTTQIATTAFVANAITGLGGVVNSFNGRSGAVTLQANDVSAAGGAVLASPAFSGVPTAPTATPGTSTSQIATTSFVTAAIAAGGGVSSFNGRTGAITLQTTDVTGAGGAPLANPTFTGVPSGPTAAVGTSNTQLATTAFVAAALTSAANVYSFNTRTGAVTLQASDITGAGGAVLASPAFTGVPTAPTPATTDNTNTVATTAFVQSVVNTISAGVVSFNGRTGVVTLLANDITAAGGAILAGPAFTGSPTAPTAAPGTSTTQLATTAFVGAAIAAGGGPYLPIGGGTLNGSLIVRPPGANVTASVMLCKPAGTGSSTVYGFAGGTAQANERWQINMPDGTAESGSNAGSNFALAAFSDTGATIGNAIAANRANLAVTLGGPLTITGALNGVTNINSAQIGSIGGVVFPGGNVVNASGNCNLGAVTLNSSYILSCPVVYMTASTTANYLSYSTSATQFTFVNNAGSVWIMRWTPDNLSYNSQGPVGGNGAYQNLCDVRSKRSIEPESRGLDVIRRLAPKIFTRDTMGHEKEIGFIADDVQPVLPEAIRVMGAVLPDGSGGLDTDRPTLGLCETSIIAILVNAVKELTTRLEALEATP